LPLPYTPSYTALAEQPRGRALARDAASEPMALHNRSGGAHGARVGQQKEPSAGAGVRGERLPPRRTVGQPRAQMVGAHTPPRSFGSARMRLALQLLPGQAVRSTLHP